MLAKQVQMQAMTVEMGSSLDLTCMDPEHPTNLYLRIVRAQGMPSKRHMHASSTAALFNRFVEVSHCVCGLELEDVTATVLDVLQRHLMRLSREECQQHLAMLGMLELKGM